jgi:hypothetical protein
MGAANINIEVVTEGKHLSTTSQKLIANANNYGKYSVPY